MIDSETVRASSIELRQANGVTAGDEPLVIDSQSPLPGVHWIIDTVSVVGLLAVRNFAAAPQPASGLFLCPPNTPSESQSDGVAGVNLQARPIALPTGIQSIALTPGFSYSMILQSEAEFIVPSGWFVRAIINVAPHTAAPGPGIASSGNMALTVSVEPNVSAQLHMQAALHDND